MGLNNNDQVPGERNENELQDDKNATTPAQIHFAPRSKYDHLMLPSTGNSR